MGEGADSSRPGSAGRRPPWVSPGVASVGAASFFSDAGHEIATAVLPSFLTGVLRGSAATLGLIEGLSDALLGIPKLLSGPLANQPTRRVQLARGGYLLTAVFTAAIGLATTVWQAGMLRAAAWIARGARTPARDTMLASLAPPDAYGGYPVGGVGICRDLDGPRSRRHRLAPPPRARGRELRPGPAAPDRHGLSGRRAMGWMALV